MSWVCPTFGRPDRLEELARSWVKCQRQTRLYVRLWTGDPMYLEYKKRKWPKQLVFYDSDAKGCGEALNDFFQRHPDEPWYGWVADDIVLRTPGGCELLQGLAEPFFIAYPNDCVQRHRIPTHYCIGGDLVREVGWLALPGLEHGFIDNVWGTLGRSSGLLRYEPRVIFQHKHFLTGQADYDEVYAASYAPGAQTPGTEMHERDLARYRDWVDSGEATSLLKQVLGEVFVACEDWEAWEQEDKANGPVLRATA